MFHLKRGMLDAKTAVKALDDFFQKTIPGGFSPHDQMGGQGGFRGAHAPNVKVMHLRHPGQAFSRNQLMDAVWQYSFYTDTSTVTVHVRRLRSKIEADPARPRHIQTVWGVGYRFQP